MSAEPGFLDTNIIVYAFDEAAPAAKRERARALLQEALATDRWCCSTQVLSEAFVTFTAKGKLRMPPALATQVVDRLKPLVRVGCDHALVMRGIDFHTTLQVSYWDGRIIAAAERAGCRELLSEDLSHGRTYAGVAVRNPFR